MADYTELEAQLRRWLADDEAHAQQLSDAATDGKWTGIGGNVAYANFGSWRGEARFAARAYPVAPTAPLAVRLAEFIALHDPAAVLADIAGKLALLDALAEIRDGYGNYDDSAWNAANLALETTLEHLAAAFVGRPEFKPEWRISA